MRRSLLTTILVLICLVLVGIELLTILHWIYEPFCSNSSNIIRRILSQTADVQLRLFFAPAFSSPFLLMLLLYAWLLIPCFKFGLNRIGIKKVRLAGKELSLRWNSNGNLSVGLGFLNKRGWSALLLVLALLLSFVYVFYAYVPIFDGRVRRVGVDVNNYVPLLEDIQDSGLVYAFSNSSGRTVSLLILYGFSFFTGLSPFTVVQFSALVLCPLMVLATHFFMQLAGFRKSISALASLFSAFSFLITVGVYSAYISNMMAWIEALIFSGLLIKSVSSRSKLYCFMAISTLMLVLFTHIWSWELLMMILACLIILYVYKLISNPPVEQLRFVSAIVSSNVIAEIVRDQILLKGSVAISTASHIVESGFSLIYPLYFWYYLNATLMKGREGLFMNPISLFLAAVGTLSVLGDVWQKDFCLFMKCWIVVLSFVFPFAAPHIQVRLLYNMPFHVLATLGWVCSTFWVKKQFKGRLGGLLAALFGLLLILGNINYGFWSMNTISNSFS